jgi:hypothetical protein
MTIPIGLLMSILGPLATQGVKALSGRYAGKLPGWSVPLLHAGLQVAGAASSSYLGINPFGDDLGAMATQAMATATLGNAAYERWKPIRPASALSNPWARPR